jgi:uncharacterized lipoprotein YmbA
VIRRGPNQIEFSELHRWGVPLGGGINEAVAGRLFQRGSFKSVDVAPWSPGERPDYLIQLDVVRFEGLVPEEGTSLEGEARMLIRWEIIRPADGAVLTRGTTDHRPDGWNVGDYAGLVTLLDAGLGALSDDLTAGIERLELSNAGITPNRPDS